MSTLYNRVNREVLKNQLQDSNIERTTVSFYQYAQIGNVGLFRDHLYRLLSDIDVLGRVYVANEGVNAQISVPTSRLSALRKSLDEIEFLKGCRLNLAIEQGDSFYKLTIKVRDKIVADGIEKEDFDVTNNARHIDAKEFNQLAENENTILIDMRNHYESEVGHFENAICPDVETFRESLPLVEKILEENSKKDIIMYCTGGIRCEKATAFFKYKGFDNLYQLDGGIIEYTRQAALYGLKNKFKGKNFVFDERLGERISDEVISNCHQCGSPSDDHTNCRNDACHILFIQCEKCAEDLNGCCSSECQEFIALPEDEQKKLRKEKIFNGTRFGKGRYKASRPNDLKE